MPFCFYISDIQRLIIWVPLALLTALLAVIAVVVCRIMIQKLSTRFVSPDIRERVRLFNSLTPYDPDSHVHWTHAWHSLCNGCQLIVSHGLNVVPTHLIDCQRNPGLQLFCPFCCSYRSWQHWRVYISPKYKYFAADIWIQMSNFICQIQRRW